MDPYADDTELADPSTLATVGLADNTPGGDSSSGFNWQGLGDFINGITPTAFGVVTAVTGKQIAASGSDSSGRAVSFASGPQPVDALAGLGASSPVASVAAATAVGVSSISSTTWLVLAGGAALVAFALLNK